VAGTPQKPAKIVQLELTSPSPDISGIAEYREVYALIRLHGSPIGVVHVPILNGGCTAASIRRAAVRDLSTAIVRHLITDALARGISGPCGTIHQLADVPHERRPVQRPTISVAVCTRNRPADLARCLEALQALRPAPLEIIVVDNAPDTEDTRRVVAGCPGVRYVPETTPGLDHARNRAVTAAIGDIIAFTDDDVVVDTGWVGALQGAFADPDVTAVTGLVMPLELETEPQQLFERYGGFARGFERAWFHVGNGESAARLHLGTGKFGTGANMAFRRAVFEEIGAFDPALDVGTLTNGGGDLEMFFRILDVGHVLMYEPNALVWHRHRREYERLRDQIVNNGVGFYSYLVQVATRCPEHRRAVIVFGAWWFAWWSLRRLAVSLYKPGSFPRDLVMAELAGSLKGLFRYQQAHTALGPRRPLPRAPRRAAPTGDNPREASVRTIDVGDPVIDIADATAGPMHLVVLRRGCVVGSLSVASRRHGIGETELRTAIARAFGASLFRSPAVSVEEACSSAAVAVKSAFAPLEEAAARLPASATASIVIATYDRPGDLKRALASLSALDTPRRVEIIVVDNHPASGLTPPVVAEFAVVRLIREPRAGLSYARNAGILASTSDIVVSTDDDVIVPPEWLENLLSGFADARVMAVTGNVLPVDLSARPQQLFELYGGLGRGLDEAAADERWLWSFRGAAPTWRLGGTANAAFRASIFSDPEIGLLDESLGAGTPTGCSEDTDLFYRILRAGGRIVYEPRAWVWHRHRTTMRALRRQIYSYAKGHVAYQLTTLARDREWRAIPRLAIELPGVYLRRLRDRLRGRSEYPLRLVLLEIFGTCVGPFAWLRSRWRVRRLGRSTSPTGAPQSGDHPRAGALAPLSRSMR
jgi:GT2 family glycosyltransferase